MPETGAKARVFASQCAGTLPALSAAVGKGKVAGGDEVSGWLLDGMHSMAQPLTTLQARYQLATIEEVPEVASYDRLLAGRREIEQLCTLFGLMQELLQLECNPARSAPVPLPRVLAMLVEDAEAAFSGYGIRLAVCESTERSITMLEVKVDLERTRKGWVALFSLAREVLMAGSELQCEMTLQGACAEITMVESGAGGRLQPRISTGEARLRLELALRCLEGTARTPEIHEAPFHARIGLELCASECE